MTNSLMRGFYAGLMAGFIIGTVFTIYRIIEAKMGLYGAVPTLVSYDFLIFHLGYAIGISGLLAAIWGAIYSKLYYGIPSKGVKKGFVYGCLIYFVSNIYIASIHFSLWLLTGFEQHFLFSYQWTIGGISLWIPYGIVLGVLYERWPL